jgi:hypothetical protein
MNIFWGACAVLALSATSASAECRTGQFNFFFGQTTSVDATTSATQGECLLGFRGGRQTVYESISPVKRPSNGSFVAHSSGQGYIYTPKVGFKGTDNAVLKVCGSGATGKGCVNVNYTITVQ